VVEWLDADVVALQEVDRVRARSGGVDQAARIAERLEMHSCFTSSFIDRAGGAYGNAVLSRRPIELMRHALLPARKGCEPRSAMWVRVALSAAGPLDVINTHLSFRRGERLGQIDALLGPEWLGGDRLEPRTILCGDLNCSPRDPGFRRLRGLLVDAQTAGAGSRVYATWPTRRPFRRIDHILATPALRVRSASAPNRPGNPRAPAVGIASDHLPLVAELDG
jgi:endonuclease/exonuclease/phosphatase family metal-dependent hydrolase